MKTKYCIAIALCLAAMLPAMRAQVGDNVAKGRWV